MNSVDFQQVSRSLLIPTQQQFQSWVDAVLSDAEQDSEVVIRIIDKDEMVQFNQQYRGKDGATNILSFTFDPPDGVDSILLGDLLVCAPMIEQEAKEQNKPLMHHWAHIIIHGVLHLLGYDHIDEQDAMEMECVEINILNKLEIKNPYEEN